MGRWQEGAGLGQGGSEGEAGRKAATQGEQGSGDGREAVARETKSVSHLARGAQHPLGRVWLRVWLVQLHLNLEQV